MGRNLPSSTPSRQSVDAACGLFFITLLPNITISDAHPLFSAVLLLLLPSAPLCFCQHSKVLNVSTRGRRKPNCPATAHLQFSRAPSVVCYHASACLACPPSIFCTLLPLSSYCEAILVLLMHSFMSNWSCRVIGLLGDLVD